MSSSLHLLVKLSTYLCRKRKWALLQVSSSVYYKRQGQHHQQRMSCMQTQLYHLPLTGDTNMEHSQSQQMFGLSWGGQPETRKYKLNTTTSWHNSYWTLLHSWNQRIMPLQINKCLMYIIRFFIVIKQFWVSIATYCQMLKCCRHISYIM